ncbi:GNAT family N-acetyltransferase [Azohydromonas sediminis]|uniref:GNAT family N-acetyltransferase n=1 Tax=Azohydromonas sediminis TaxID=2259674 RepID=UPI000E657A9E|nr:GNAT family N-acyltransferase [Azohydromonas sediminis]
MRDLPLPTRPLAALLHRPPADDAAARDAGATRAAVRIDVAWACDEEDVRAAQRLRHRVFVDEMGAQPRVPPGTPAGHDADVFDPFCEHLLVRVHRGADEAPEVVGTYRVLTPEAARRAGGYYTDTEFDLTRLRALRPSMVELGRACVAPQWRDGAVILALWNALADFLGRNRFDTAIGCASVSMRDGGHLAASLWARLDRSHRAPIQWQVRPRLPLPIESLRCDLDAPLPSLIKGYLRCGARLLGTPAWDPDFATADLPLLLRTADLPARFRRPTAVA